MEVYFIVLIEKAQHGFYKIEGSVKKSNAGDEESTGGVVPTNHYQPNYDLSAGIYAQGKGKESLLDQILALEQFEQQLDIEEVFDNLTQNVILLIDPDNSKQYDFAQHISGSNKALSNTASANAYINKKQSTTYTLIEGNQYASIDNQGILTTTAKRSKNQIIKIGIEKKGILTDVISLCVIKDKSIKVDLKRIIKESKKERPIVWAGVVVQTNENNKAYEKGESNIINIKGLYAAEKTLQECNQSDLA